MEGGSKEFPGFRMCPRHRWHAIPADLKSLVFHQGLGGLRNWAKSTTLEDGIGVTSAIWCISQVTRNPEGNNPTAFFDLVFRF